MALYFYLVCECYTNNNFYVIGLSDFIFKTEMRIKKIVAQPTILGYLKGIRTSFDYNQWDKRSIKQSQPVLKWLIAIETARQNRPKLYLFPPYSRMDPVHKLLYYFLNNTPRALFNIRPWINSYPHISLL